jgi:hypothetical protein
MHKKILAKEKKIPEKQEKNTGKHAHSHTVGARAHGHKEGFRRWSRGWGVKAEEGGEGERTPSQLESTAMARQQGTHKGTDQCRVVV